MRNYFANALADLSAADVPPTHFNILRRYWSDPSFATLQRWRWSCALHRKGLAGRLLSKLLWKHNIRISACHLSPRAILGPGLVMPHAAAIVVGDGVRIEQGSVIYQRVTLGRATRQSDAYPSIGSGTCLYAGACVLGGHRVGDGAIVAANAVVTTDVAPNTVVGGVPARLISKAPHE